MRIRVNLELINLTIPVHYNSLIQGSIYNAIFTDNNSKLIHDHGYKLEKRKFKLFTFSSLHGKTVYNNETKSLTFTSNAYFEFSSYYENIVLLFVNFLTNNKSLLLGNKIIRINSFAVVDFKFKQSIEFHTISPITAYITVDGKKTRYFNPAEEEFKESILNNLRKKYYLIYNENMPEIEISSISNIKEKRVYFRNNFAYGYECNILFKNLTSKVFKIIIDCGLGSKNSSGFGMVSIN